MDTILKTVAPLPDYRLALTFRNGSSAVVNMERRVRTLRFARLASPQVFRSVKAEGDKVVWADEKFENQQKLFDIGVALAPGEQGEISVTFPVQGDGSTHISFLLANTAGETFGLGPQMRGDLYIEYRVQ